MNKEKLLILTNLYPLPWEPNRATFNKQQFELLKDDYDIHIAIPIAWPEYLKKAKEFDLSKEEGITYFPYFYTPKKGRRYYPKLMKWSMKLFAKDLMSSFRPDKILASWAFPEGIVGSELAEELNIPFYLKVHGTDINGHGEFPERAKQIVKAANKARGVLSVSQALADRMIEMGVEKEKISVIYNGVNKEKFFLDLSVKQEKTILYVGNLKDTKGVMELMKAFAPLSLSTAQGYKLVYAGAGPMMSKLKEFAEKHKIEDKIEFLGSVNHNEIAPLMKKSKMVALPSYAEGVPNVLLEAMSCGIPVVATSVGGIPEIVEEGKTGKLAEVKSVGDFNFAIDYIIRNEWDRGYIAKYAEKFDWNKNKKELLSLLNKN